MAQHTWTFQTNADPSEESDPRSQMASCLVMRINGEDEDVEAGAGSEGLLTEFRDLMERARLSWVR